MSIVCFRFIPQGAEKAERELNRLNRALVEALQATQRAFLSSTRLGARVALRFCFVNWRTTAADVEEVIQLLESLGNDLARKASP